MRCMPCAKSSSVMTLSATAGDVKLGHPVPESNFVSDANRAAPHAAQWYMPSSWLWTYLPVKGGSVPLRRRTSYCSGVNSSRHSLSVFSTESAMADQRTISRLYERRADRHSQPGRDRPDHHRFRRCGDAARGPDV